MVYSSALDLIGKTPIVELKNIEKELGLKSRIFAKVELFNPAGSIKDRVALSMIESAEREGKISPEKSVIIEPTSGNTGIGLAMVGALKGYRVIIVMPENMSKERVALISAYGAEVVLTEASEGISGSIKKAEELKESIENSFIPMQFENLSNPECHFLTTGREIFEDMDKKIDTLVATFGTGGTVCGIAKYLKSQGASTEIVAVEPASSPFASQGRSGKHKIQGIGAGFIPKTMDLSLVDRILTVSDEDAYEYGALLCKKEGLCVGISSGACLKAGIDIALEESGKNIVIVLPDTGLRYLSEEGYF